LAFSRDNDNFGDLSKRTFIVIRKL